MAEKSFDGWRATLSRLRWFFDLVWRPDLIDGHRMSVRVAWEVAGILAK